MRFTAQPQIRRDRRDEDASGPRRGWRAGAVLNLALGAAALSGIVIMASVSATKALREVNGLTTSPAPLVNMAPTPQQIELELLRVGLNPKTLACAGCIQADVSTLVSKAQAHLATGYEGLSQAQSEYEQAKFERDRLQRVVRAGTASQEQIQQLAAAETTLATKSAALDTARAGLFDAATESLESGCLATVEIIRGQDRWSFPSHFKAASRSHADAIALRNALANIRINPEYGLDVDPAAQTLVEDELEKPAVATAKAAYDARYAGLKSQWETSLGL
jgi:hypothetical protein